MPYVLTEGRGYKGRVSMTDELPRGNVSLRLRDAQKSDSGKYRCEVTHGEYKVKTNEVHLTVSGTENILLIS